MLVKLALKGQVFLRDRGVAMEAWASESLGLAVWARDGSDAVRCPQSQR